MGVIVSVGLVEQLLGALKLYDVSCWMEGGREGHIEGVRWWRRLASYPGHAEKKSGLVSTVRACARIYGIGSVNVSVNGLSHMPRSGTETVYCIVSERTKKQTFYN